jgi:hypothetical protein
MQRKVALVILGMHILKRRIFVACGWRFLVEEIAQKGPTNFHKGRAEHM